MDKTMFNPLHLLALPSLRYLIYLLLGKINRLQSPQCMSLLSVMGYPELWLSVTLMVLESSLDMTGMTYLS